MDNGYLLGIDTGNTSTKAAIYARDGRELSIASCPVNMEHPQPGWTERSMGIFWEDVAWAIREATARAGIDPACIVGMGCCGHGNGLYLLDEAGHPLWNAIPSLDMRAEDILAEWRDAGLRQRVYDYTLQSFYAAQTHTLLAWFKRHRPDVYARIGAVLLSKDLVNYHLTGVLSTDYTDMSCTSLLDVANRCYEPALLDVYGIPEMAEALPPLAKSAEVIGHITPEAAEKTGLPEGLPVVGGMIDMHASALGAGAVQPGDACIIIGTWSINGVIADRPIADPDLFLTCIFPVPGRWMTIEASGTAAANLEWFIREFCAEERHLARDRGVSVYAICGEKVREVPADETSVIFHPYLYGSGTSTSARAGFYGLAGWHTRAHLLRALYEGVVFNHLDHIERLNRAGLDFEVARLAGGGAQSEVWAQMLADALAKPVEIAEGAESGTRGAALAAGIGAGIYADYEDAVRRGVRVTRRFEPDLRRHAIYSERYAEYKHLGEVMAGPWERLSRLEGSYKE